MAESKLRNLSIEFSVKVINICDNIKGHYSLVNQLERSATSIGANIHEANYAHSKADFIAKLQIALKESYETEYWIELFVKSNLIDRDAVPDKNFRNEWYQNIVKIGGNGDPNHPAFTHKIVYDYLTFAQVFIQAGFEVELLEWCDENGEFHYKYWNEEEGRIGRSLRFDTRNQNGKLGMVSIILDAKKPLKIKSPE